MIIIKIVSAEKDFIFFSIIRLSPFQKHPIT
nr:MAG TPA: hypothetical protein [Caudoviricetes sp.]